MVAILRLIFDLNFDRDALGFEREELALIARLVHQPLKDPSEHAVAGVVEMHLLGFIDEFLCGGKSVMSILPSLPRDHDQRIEECDMVMVIVDLGEMVVDDSGSTIKPGFFCDSWE